MNEPSSALMEKATRAGVTPTALLLMEDIADDKYQGYELHAAVQLKDRLPIGFISWEDLVAYARLWAVEAAHDFVPQGARFSTYLVKHLHTRSLQLFNYSWLKQNHPEGQWVSNFTSFESEDGDGDFDPTMVEDSDLRLQLLELVEAMTDRARQLLQVIFIRIDETLILAFGSSRPHRAVSKILGVPQDEVAHLIHEFRDKAPKYLRGFNAWNQSSEVLRMALCS